jgi:ATP-dependent protease ClpP protease subunit
MIFLELAGFTVAGMVMYKLHQVYNRQQRTKKVDTLSDNSIISLVDSRHVGLMNKLENLETRSSLTQDTFMKFKDNLRKAIKKSSAQDEESRQITIVLHTLGGHLMAAEAISRQILLARDRGFSVVCYVPYYACSGGCMIAACCDQIFMTDSSFLGPADAQASSAGSVQSVASLIKTVEWQMENCPKKIDPTMLANYHQAKSTQIRQTKWVNEMVKREFFTREIGDKIYLELFSGIYNHDQLIDPNWAKEIGLPVSIIEEMPDFVEDALTLAHAKPE